MQKPKFSPTTKDIALLHQLQQDDQLKLQPEFQRNSVWSKSAKALRGKCCNELNSGVRELVSSCGAVNVKSDSKLPNE